jgi:fructose-1,6-bisphosphatase
LSELTPTSGEKSSNIFLENSGAESKEDVEKEKENFVSSYIRRFIAASVLTIINILLIGLIFSYRIYLQQTSQISVDKDYE